MRARSPRCSPAATCGAASRWWCGQSARAASARTRSIGSSWGRPRCRGRWRCDSLGRTRDRINHDLCTHDRDYLLSALVNWTIRHCCLMPLCLCKLLGDPPPRDVANLLQRVVNLRLNIIRNAIFHFGYDRISTLMQGQSHDNRESKFAAVAAINVAHDRVRRASGP